MAPLSWSPEDHLRHFMYESIFAVLKQATYGWRHHARKPLVLDFGSKWYADEDGGWRTYMRTMCKELFGRDGFTHRLATYPEVDIERMTGIDTIDLLIADQVLEHVEHPWLAAESISLVVRSGGIAVITTPGLYPIHQSPKDCWRIMPDGYRALFPESRWEHLKLGAWGTRARVGYEYASKGGFPYGPPTTTVEQAQGEPAYTSMFDGRCPLMLWFVGRRRG